MNDYNGHFESVHTDRKRQGRQHKRTHVGVNTAKQSGNIRT